jgi:hypothetical protein
LSAPCGCTLLLLPVPFLSCVTLPSGEGITFEGYRPTPREELKRELKQICEVRWTTAGTGIGADTNSGNAAVGSDANACHAGDIVTAMLA